MIVKLHESHHIVPQDAPEGVDDSSSKRSAMQESADASVAICVTPDARAEPGQEARVCCRR